MGDYWEVVFLEGRDRNIWTMWVFVSIFISEMEKKNPKKIAGKILESTVIGSAAKNENWTVN